MASTGKSKNDKAWERLFDEYNILEQINRKGQFIINSAQINEVRESRLMAKFDQSVNLPQIFRNNRLSILPVSRSKYILAPIDTHQLVTYDTNLEIVSIPFPAHIESIDYSNLYSEAVALNCAFIAKIIDDLLEEETIHTISGRMSTESFSFSINSTDRNQSSYRIDVDHSQCEIDGGFEGRTHFALIEAKSYTVDDFLIRQLYYPYRLWSGKLRKKIVPILMIFSQDVFHFFIYEFTDETQYSSLRLVQQRRYAIAPEEITRSDVNVLLSQIKSVPEPTGIPFPQADRFDRVVDLLTLLAVRDLTKDDITANYQFDIRQTNYYTDAGRYLGLIRKFTDPDTGEVTFTLTDEARLLLRQRHKQKYLDLIRKIFEHVVYNRTFRLALGMGRIPTEDEISQVIIDSQINIGGATVGRRSRTVRSWIKWIWEQIED